MELRCRDTIKKWYFVISFNDIQDFLAFPSYYLQLIKRFSRIDTSLPWILGEGSQRKFKAYFIITINTKRWFYTLHQALITFPILRHFDFFIPIEIRQMLQALVYWRFCFSHTPNHVIAIWKFLILYGNSIWRTLQNTRVGNSCSYESLQPVESLCWSCQISGHNENK